MRKSKKLKIMFAVMTAVFGSLPTALALPVGGNAVGDTATISATGDVMTVAGTGDSLITWHDFSIANGEKVNFTDAHTYLNYVVGANRSQIDGEIGGQAAKVYLINPNGIVFGETAEVKVGNLHLSTADLSGKLDSYTTALNGLNSSGIVYKGDVINKGKLNATEITVKGNNITFKNTEDVTVANASNVKLTANNGGEIHIGSENASDPGYTTSGATYLYKLIGTPEKLQNMQNNLSGNYMLKSDIDMNGFSNFTPIGHNESGRFTGRLDGLNYAIKNLTITNTVHEKLGLFGWLGGRVENVGIKNGHISIGDIHMDSNGNIINTNTDNKSVAVGAFAGGLMHGGVLKNVYTDEDTTVEGYNHVGGLTGQIFGDGTLQCLVENSYNAATVSVQDGNHSYDRAFGGISGIVNSGTIKNSYNKGKIIVDSGNDGTMVGGIIGGSNKIFAIENVYNTGEISSTFTKTDPIAGSLHNNTTIRNAYYLAGTSANTFTNRGVSLTDEQMKSAASFSGFGVDKTGSDSSAAWRIYEGHHYPLLTSFLTPIDFNNTVTYDGKNHGLLYSASVIDSNKFTALNSINATRRNAGTYKYELYSSQHGYNILTSEDSAATLTITPAPLTLKVKDDYSKEYDGTTAAPGAEYEITEGTIFTGDAASDATFSFDNASVGTGKTLSLTNITVGDGVNNNNYAINVVNSVTASITGNPADTPVPTNPTNPTDTPTDNTDTSDSNNDGITTNPTDNTVTPNGNDNGTAPNNTDNIVKPNSTDSTVTPNSADSSVIPNNTDTTVTPDNANSSATPNNTDSTSAPNNAETVANLVNDIAVKETGATVPQIEAISSVAAAPVASVSVESVAPATVGNVETAENVNANASVNTAAQNGGNNAENSEEDANDNANMNANIANTDITGATANTNANVAISNNSNADNNTVNNTGTANANNTSNTSNNANTSGDKNEAKAGKTDAASKTAPHKHTWTGRSVLTIKNGGVKPPKAMDGEEISHQREEHHN